MSSIVPNNPANRSRRQWNPSLLQERLISTGPKRILAIDGTILRGGFALAFLRRLEAVLTKAAGANVLSDYFDLIGGMGMGAVLATALAQGRTVSETEQLCGELMRAALSEEFFFNRFLSQITGSRSSAIYRNELFSDERFDEVEWKTGVCLLTHRMDSGELMTLHNHPAQARGRVTGSWRIKQCLEACLAKPPAKLPAMPVEPKGTGVFADGTLSMSGGACWPLFEVATSDNHRFKWRMGAQNLFLVSIGTGYWVDRESVESALSRTTLQWVIRLPSMFLTEASRQSRLFLESIARTLTPVLSEAVVENDSGDNLFAQPRLTFAAYDANLNDSADKEPERLAHLRSPATQKDLESVRVYAQKLAGQVVRAEHFEPELGTGPATNQARARSGQRRISK